MVLGEIGRGVARSHRRCDYAQAENLDAWLRRLIHLFFSNRILPVDASIAEVWGQMYAIRNVPVINGLLAATAKVHNLTLATRNITDVQSLDANRLNPFTG